VFGVKLFNGGSFGFVEFGRTHRSAPTFLMIWLKVYFWRKNEK